MKRKWGSRRNSQVSGRPYKQVPAATLIPSVFLVSPTVWSSFQRPVSSSLSCPLEVIFDLFTEGNGGLLSSLVPTSQFFPCVWLLLTFSRRRASLCNPDVRCAVRLAGGSSLAESASFLSHTVKRQGLGHPPLRGRRRQGAHLSRGTASGRKLISLRGMSSRDTTRHHPSPLLLSFFPVMLGIQSLRLCVRCRPVFTLDYSLCCFLVMAAINSKKPHST